jgi:HK97 family phage major capsid protein
VVPGLGRSRRNAAQFIHQDIEPQLYALYQEVGTGGVPVYLPASGVAGNPYSTVYGRPVIPIEQCSTLGDVGDIILGDMSQYILADKSPRTDISMHVRFIYDELAFRFTYRVNGQPAWKTALTPANGSNTLSPFVTLEARA